MSKQNRPLSLSPNVIDQEEIQSWKMHSTEFLEMAYDYSKHETNENPDGYGKNTGDCGDTVEMFLTVKKDTIQFVSLRIDGCVNTNACANTVVSMVEGNLVDQAWDVTPEKVVEYLKTLPPGSTHCAELAVGALYKALSDYRKR